MGWSNPRVVIGLTGGIACGKSTVAAMLEARGIPVVDADAVARDVVAPGTEGAEAVRARFGDAVMAPDGGVLRAALASRVFPVAEERAALNAILHPRIAALLHLLAQRQPCGLRHGHDEALLHVVGRQAFKSRLAAVCVDELAAVRQRQAVHWEIVQGGCSIGGQRQSLKWKRHCRS